MAQEANSLRWGILGPGKIARSFARNLQDSHTGRLIAVGSRTKKNAQSFGAEFDLPAAGCHGSYQQLLDHEDVDVIYVSTPHPMHVEWVIKAAEAGKHILCEKPLGINRPQADAMIDAAIRHDVFLMEAFMYRCHPQTHHITSLIEQNAIGEVRLIQATFGGQLHFDKEHRIYANHLGGGGILDLGCYPVSMARLLAGRARGRPFADPIEVQAVGHLCETGVDAWSIANLRFEGDILAQLTTSIQFQVDSHLQIWGSAGHIRVCHPWIPAAEGGDVTIELSCGGETETQTITSDQPIYAIEADTVARHIGQRQAPAMNWADTLGNMRTLDRWRSALGFVLAEETPAHRSGPMHGRPPSRRSAAMIYGRVPGVEKDVARVIMGSVGLETYPHASALFDAYFENGGNAFDTAYIYGNGNNERHLGLWVANRGVRDQIVIIDKGGHSPNCTPHSVTRQIEESLERLQSYHIDIYLLHRDNPDVPVEEFVDVLNDHHRAGRIGSFGGSNWSIPRLELANSYARRSGKVPFSVLSNQFSLAQMIDPVWDGCLSASDVAYRQYLQRTQQCLLSWSSQARGFFTDRAGRDRRDDAELVRCWYSDDNFGRRDRAIELAGQLGVDPITIALAYVLHQPFATFALIGPEQTSELRSSLGALHVELTEEKVRWLETGLSPSPSGRGPG